MTARKTLARIEALIWVLIYGGLFAMIIGFVAGDVHVVAGWSLGVLGAIAVAAGVVLIWVRSRMTEPVGAPDLEQEPRQRTGSPPSRG